MSTCVIYTMNDEGRRASKLAVHLCFARLMHITTRSSKNYDTPMTIKGFSQQGTMEAVRRAMKFGLIFLIAASFLITLLSACSKQSSYPAPQKIGADIVIEISSLELEVPKFYTYHYQGKDINFFVLKMPDRTLSFLDACISCYPHKLGYRWDGNEVICRYCNMRFPIGNLEKGIGSCCPIKIGGRTENGKYLISAPTLESSSDKF